MIISEIYSKLCETPSDIYEHLPTLKKYADEVDHVTEMGVRWIVSTWALLAGNPNKLISIDIKHPNEYGADLGFVEEAVKETNIEFLFIEGNTLEIEIEKTDFLFIDTLHTYNQLSQELERHSENVNKYIALHDTITFGYKDEQLQPSVKFGLMPALNEFLEKNNNWIIKEVYENNNGLTVLQRN